MPQIVMLRLYAKKAEPSGQHTTGTYYTVLNSNSIAEKLVICLLVVLGSRPPRSMTNAPLVAAGSGSGGRPPRPHSIEMG